MTHSRQLPGKKGRRTDARAVPEGQATTRVDFEDNGLTVSVFGEYGAHLTLIEKELDVEAHARGNRVTLVGPRHNVSLARELLAQLYDMARRGRALGPADVRRAAAAVMEKSTANLREIYEDTVLVSSRGRRITPKSPNQKKYVEAMRDRDIVFAIGPAGTGKTYLAMAMAVRALQEHAIKRVILTRPAVEAGEKLGFLPGSMLEKVNPYLRPLYDALNDMMDFNRVTRLVDDGQLEVAPLAFMRGRTLNDSFVVLDEAQNTTSEQMKMFLTRLGYDSKAVITGDITQTDLPENRISGLVEASQILRDVEGIAFCSFTEKDVVRHRLVQEVIKAYESHKARKGSPPGGANGAPGPRPESGRNGS